MANPRTNVAVQTAPINLRRLLARQLVPLILVLLGLWLLRDRVLALDMSMVWRTLDQVSARQWALACAATGLSFWAIGRYDQLIHGLMGRNTSPTQARHSGAAAIAVSQFAGCGVITGALVRWRLLDDLTLAGALKISLAVSLSFLSGWAVIASVMVLLSDIGDTATIAGGHLGAVAFAVIALAGLFIPLSIWQPRFLRRIPSLRSLATILVLAFVDTLCACAALWVLLPPDLMLAPMQIYTVFLLATGAGLIGSTPGGFGPFEVTMLALLPAINAEPLLASILGFRLIYHALPATLALAALLWRPQFSRRS